MPKFYGNDRAEKEMDGLEVLTEGHGRVEDLFDALEREEPSVRRRERVEELAHLLSVHSLMEKQHLYPAVRGQNIEELLGGFLEDHAAIRRALGRLLATPPADPRFTARLRGLRQLFRAHSEEEEEVLFPWVKEILRGPTLARLADELGATREAAGALGVHELLGSDAAPAQS